MKKILYIFYTIFICIHFIACNPSEQEEKLNVSFDFNYGNNLQSLEVSVGSKLTRPEDPERLGYILLDWYKDPDFKEIWYFDSDQVFADLILYARWRSEIPVIWDLECGFYIEAIWATWEGENVSDTFVFYKNTLSKEWLQVDSQLIRMDNNKPRVDIVGISEGSYDIKVERDADLLYAYDVYTMGHDRSGYAHFNYLEGVGAYKDDGTLKDDAVVVYVTEENKNEIEIEGIKQKGLGWILNNAQYSKSESNTYNPKEAAGSISSFNKPIAIRIIGKITTPEGATGYDSTINGGSKGDNGNMLRIKNANNITIEGIGEDASLDGWGIHFMASEVGRGIGFEARNLIFDKYPEDALGLEGVQEGSNLTVPVQRGWIHNCTFLPGFAENPAESDKANGDGSLDIKRGLYFTISYCQFIGAHKTNLVGGKDSDIQYHVTMHHNLWQNTASRVPLARAANIHMYNNVFETTDDNTNEVSVCQDVRADAYIFSEANYFFGIKRPTLVKSGAVKSYGEVKYSVYNDNDATLVTNRTTKVNSNNKYANFDTNPDVFYYDPINQKSDVKHLTDPVTARAEVNVYSGAYHKYETPDIDNYYVTNIEPTLISNDIVGGEDKINKQEPLLVFKLITNAVFKMTAGDKDVLPVLVNIYGETILLGTGEVKIEAGVYVLESSISHGNSKGKTQAKESSISSYEIKIDSEALKEARVNEAIYSISLLPDEIIYSQEVRELLEEARGAYNNLKDDETSLVDESKLLAAEAKYKTSGINYIEALINDIGVVGEDSWELINKARLAYDQAMPEIKEAISNYNQLTASESQFEEFLAEAVINLINELKDVNLVNRTDEVEIVAELENYNNVFAAYDLLSSEQKDEVINKDKLLLGIPYLEESLFPFPVIELINEIDLENITLANHDIIIEAKSLFDLLDDEGKTIITNDLILKLNQAYQLYEELFSRVIIHNFTINQFQSDFFEFPAKKNTTGLSTIYNGEELTIALKMESATQISFTTAIDNMKLLLLVSSEKPGGALKVNGNIVLTDITESPQEYILNLDDAGEYLIEKGTGQTFIFYMMLYLD